MNEPIPFFEELSSACAGLREGSQTSEYAREKLLSIEATVNLARKELETEAAPELQEELSSLESAFSRFDEGARLLKLYLDDADGEALESGLARMKPAFVEMREGLLGFGLKKATLNPSPDPSLNLLLNFGKGVLDGVCTTALLENAFSYYEAELRRIGRTLKRLRKMTESNPGINAFLESCAPDDHEACLHFSRARAEFAHGNYSGMLEALELLRPFAVKCSQLSRNLAKFFQHDDEKNCPRCSRANASQTGYCASCGFLFPHFGETPPGLGFLESDGRQKLVMTRNLERLLNGMEDFQDGEIDRKEWDEILNWMREKVEKGMKPYQSLEMLPSSLSNLSPVLAREVTALFVSVVEKYKDGVESMRAGLLSLKGWSGSVEETSHSDAIAQILDGAAKIQEAVFQAEGAVADFESLEKKEVDQFACDSPRA